jgi:hypothetical protein
LAIVSLICPVFGTPAGTCVGSGGAIAVVDVAQLRVAELVVDRDESHRVGEIAGVADGVDAGEGRDDHRVGERQDAAAVEFDLAIADLGDDRVGQAFDAEPVEEAGHAAESPTPPRPKWPR